MFDFDVRDVLPLDDANRAAVDPAVAVDVAVVPAVAVVVVVAVEPAVAVDSLAVVLRAADGAV